jgi:hypothetical protein
MHRLTETTARRRAGILARMPTWIGRRQRELSDWVHAAGDDRAHQYAWTVTESTGRFGFGARSYRDPRFEDHRDSRAATRDNRPGAARGSVG